ncbi:MAG: type II secretion system F family protein [Erysipelotrichaceae bacterium]|nr:type II secretion system F family protein [Erysipelotrichaceae bacterium]
MASLRKMRAEKYLGIEDLSYLGKLLDSGLSIRDCFSLLKTKKNKSLFEKITEKLDEGEPIEKAIEGFLPKKIRPYTLTLLSSLPFSSALSLSLMFYEKNEEGSKNILSKIAYPLLLLFVSVSSLYLFDLYGIDSIFSLISTFEDDIGLYKDLRILLRITANLFYYGTLLLFSLSIFFLRPERIVLLYIFFSRHFPNSFVNIYCCEEFMSLFLICIRKGYSTKEALHILKSMKSKPIISFLAFHMDEGLMEGESMKEAAGKYYYDPSLSRFIKIANYTSDFSVIIESYIFMAREKISRRMKNYTLGIQLITYAFIGLVIIFVYQILFMPMRAISIF